MGLSKEGPGEELRRLWALAGPLSAANGAVYLRSMISVLCLGRLGRLPLAGGAMALVFTNITGYSVLLGLASGLEPICSQAHGSRNPSLLSLSAQRAALLLLFSSLPIAALWLSLDPLLSLLLRQDPAISAVAAAYARYALPDLLAAALLHPLRVFLRSQGLARPIMWSAWAAAAVHGPLSWALAFQLRMGVAGVALAQAFTNLSLLGFLLGYVYLSGASRAGWTGWSREALSGLGPLVRLALPSCAAVCLEWWWYEIVTLLAGYLPEPQVAVAAAAVLIQTTSLMYTVPMALAAAVSARVGNELGAGRPERARRAAAVALSCGLAVGACNVAWTAAVPRKWAALFTGDEAVVAMAAAALPLVGLCELGNCPQTTGCGVLRGTARPTTAAIINFVSFYLVGTPVAVALAFGLGRGFSGLWAGLLAAQTACAVSVLAVVLLRTDWEVETGRARKLTAVEMGGAAAGGEKERLVNGHVSV
ncbi:MATE efflux family protein [Wolffia australiana]